MLFCYKPLVHKENIGLETEFDNGNGISQRSLNKSHRVTRLVQGASLADGSDPETIHYKGWSARPSGGKLSCSIAMG